MSNILTKKEFLTLFIPSLLIATLFFVVGFVFQKFNIWDSLYTDFSPRVGDSYEVMLEKLQEKPTRSFGKGDDEGFKEYLKAGGYVLRDEVAGEYPGGFLGSEDYAKVLYRENGEVVRKDPPQIEGRVYIFGSYVLDIIYVNEFNQVTHVFTGAN